MLRMPKGQSTMGACRIEWFLFSEPGEVIQALNSSLTQHLGPALARIARALFSVTSEARSYADEYGSTAGAFRHLGEREGHLPLRT